MAFDTTINKHKNRAENENDNPFDLPIIGVANKSIVALPKKFFQIPQKQKDAKSTGHDHAQQTGSEEIMEKDFDVEIKNYFNPFDKHSNQ